MSENVAAILNLDRGAGTAKVAFDWAMDYTSIVRLFASPPF